MAGHQLPQMLSIYVSRQLHINAFFHLLMWRRRRRRRRRHLILSGYVEERKDQGLHIGFRTKFTVAFASEFRSVKCALSIMMAWWPRNLPPPPTPLPAWLIRGGPEDCNGRMLKCCIASPRRTSPFLLITVSKFYFCIRPHQKDHKAGRPRSNVLKKSFRVLMFAFLVIALS